jgi:RNA polymerase sigma-70 factor (ECF subfamily)
MDSFDNKIWQASFKYFYQKYARVFWTFICKTCGDQALADDIFQESWFRFLRASPAHLLEHQRKAYLYKIGVRLVIDHQRKRKLEEKYQVEEKMAIEDHDRSFLSHDMEKIFHMLKPRERTLMWLAYVEEYSHKEISRIVNLKEKSIKVQLFRIRSKFAAILRQQGYSGEELT